MPEINQVVSFQCKHIYGIISQVHSSTANMVGRQWEICLQGRVGSVHTRTCNQRSNFLDAHAQPSGEWIYSQVAQSLLDVVPIRFTDPPFSWVCQYHEQGLYIGKSVQAAQSV